MEPDVPDASAGTSTRNCLPVVRVHKLAQGALRSPKGGKLMFRIARGLCAVGITLASVTGTLARDFNSVVETVLSNQPQITDLAPDRRSQMIACVKKVLVAVPRPTQQYVAEAPSYNEMENRFGEIVMADRAKFKQRITKACGSIATSQ
jgi:hypothetical protein